MALRAGIDIGTNTILLLVAEVGPEGVRAIEDHVTVVRLGQGVDKNRAFAPEAMERALECFRRYREVIDRYPGIEVRAAATSGSRDAANSGEFFARVEKEYAIPVRVISGEEEALYSFRGALPAGTVEPESIAVLDIGGGSTEIVGMESGSLFRFSFDLGCVRLSERFLRHDPALASEIQEAREYISVELGKQSGILERVKGRTLVGVAGTATYLAAAAAGLDRFEPEKVDGRVVSAEAVSSLIERFRPMTAQARLGIGGMDRGRADVIVAGALILAEVLKKAELASYRASVRGLRYGLVL